MKHFVTLLFWMFCSVATVSAQSWFGDDGGADMKRSQWGIDLGVGKMADVDGSVGFSGGIRYQLGYGHDFYVEEGGLALELNLGINITSHLSLGYVFNMQKLKFENATAEYKFNGLRLGFLF